MPNLEQLVILYRGVKDWNEWRKENPEIKPDFRGVPFTGGPFIGANLNGVNLTDTDLREANLNATQLINANLSGANLWGASLRDADLREANLSGANLNNAILGRADLRYTNLKEANLSGANLSGANLHKADLSDADLKEAYLREADLIKANLRKADLRKADLFRAYLREANLSGANLQDTNLSETDLNWKDLSGVNLSGACLAKVQALGTNFEKAKLTGACLQDWNINSATKLDDVSCDYVYLKQDQQERRPSSGNFAPGEFTKLFQKARETIDLIFLNGIDWQAFLVSFQQLQVEAGENVLSIQSIENKDDGAFVIRVSVPPELDKSQIEQCFKRKYQLAIEAKDKQYRKYLRERLKDKDDVIANYREQISEMKSIRQDNTRLIGIIETMAEKEGSKYQFNQPQIGNFIDTAQSGSRQQSINHQHNYASEQKQTLAEAAAEIQQLLDQLQTEGYSPEKAQQKVASDLASKAQSNPTVKNQLVKWRQYLGDAAANGLIGEAVVTVFKLGFQLMGIPIP